MTTFEVSARYKRQWHSIALFPSLTEANRYIRNGFYMKKYHKPEEIRVNKLHDFPAETWMYG